MPFYQFNKFTGRLKESTHPQPFYPISPNPLHNVDPPTMIYDTIKTKPVKVNGGSASYSTLPPKFTDTFKKLQADMEFPVYRGLGKKDRALVVFTTVAVTAMALNNFYLFATKK